MTYEIRDTTGRVWATAEMPEAVFVAKALAAEFGPTEIVGFSSMGINTAAEWETTIDNFRKLFA